MEKIFWIGVIFFQLFKFSLSYGFGDPIVTVETEEDGLLNRTEYQKILDELDDWKSLERLNDAFFLIAESRYPLTSGELVRNSGKYRNFWWDPWYGSGLCHVRASLVNFFLLTNDFPSGKALYAGLERGDFAVRFGNQWKEGSDQESEGTYISFNWHTALAVRVGEVVYMLDPTLERYYPLELNEWLAKAENKHIRDIKLVENYKAVWNDAAHSLVASIFASNESIERTLGRTNRSYESGDPLKSLLNDDFGKAVVGRSLGAE